MQEVKPTDVFFIGVRAIGVFLVGSGLEDLVATMFFMNGTERLFPGALILRMGAALILGGSMFLFADSMTIRWQRNHEVSVSAVFIALSGLLLTASSFPSLLFDISRRLQVAGRFGNTGEFSFLLDQISPQYGTAARGLSVLGGILVLLLSHRLPQWLDPNWRRRARVTMALHEDFDSEPSGLRHKAT